MEVFLTEKHWSNADVRWIGCWSCIWSNVGAVRRSLSPKGLEPDTRFACPVTFCRQTDIEGLCLMRVDVCWCNTLWRGYEDQMLVWVWLLGTKHVCSWKMHSRTSLCKNQHNQTLRLRWPLRGVSVVNLIAYGSKRCPLRSNEQCWKERTRGSNPWTRRWGPTFGHPYLCIWSMHMVLDQWADNSILLRSLQIDLGQLLDISLGILTYLTSLWA